MSIESSPQSEKDDLEIAAWLTKEGLEHRDLYVEQAGEKEPVFRDLRGPGRSAG